MTTKPLTAVLRESIEARRTATPEQYKLDLLARELPELRKALAGVNWLLNLAVANSREAVAENAALHTTVHSLREELADLKAAIGEQQLVIDANSERIENMAQWAKTKGKT